MKATSLDVTYRHVTLPINFRENFLRNKNRPKWKKSVFPEPLISREIPKIGKSNYEQVLLGKVNISSSGHGSDVLKPKLWGTVAWMTLDQVVGLVQARLQKRRSPQGPWAILLLGHCTRALDCQTNETKRVVCQVEHQVYCLSPRRGSSVGRASERSQSGATLLTWVRGFDSRERPPFL